MCKFYGWFRKTTKITQTIGTKDSTIKIENKLINENCERRQSKTPLTHFMRKKRKNVRKLRRNDACQWTLTNATCCFFFTYRFIEIRESNSHTILHCELALAGISKEKSQNAKKFKNKLRLNATKSHKKYSYICVYVRFRMRTRKTIY